MSIPIEVLVLSDSDKEFLRAVGIDAEDMWLVDERLVDSCSADSDAAI